MAEKKAFKRLSKNVIPSNYNITLQPDLISFTFTGTSIIDVEVKKECSRITLNSKEITVASVSYISNDNKVQTAEILHQVEKETVAFKFPEQLTLGNGQLKLHFTGELNDKLMGFYRSKYTTPDNEERYCAVTQFAPTDARRAFPCWDEPAVKATFEITIIAPKDRVVLSNMDVFSASFDETDASLQKVVFNKTPIMSTYLVAFAVGEFDYVEEVLPTGVSVRVYTPLGKSDQGKFALKELWNIGV